MKAGELSKTLTGTCRVDSVPWLGSTVEMALEMWLQLSLPQGHESRRADPVTCYDGTWWPAQSQDGEFALMVHIRESWKLKIKKLRKRELTGWPAQLPHRLWISPPKNLYHLPMVGAHEKASPADPKLHNLHDTGQQRDNWQESWWGANMDDVTEAKDLEPDGWLMARNIYNVKMCGQRNIL